jgi:FkbH-like protein
MGFLEASRCLRSAQGLPEMEVCLKTSGSLNQLHLYLKASGVNRGINLNVRSIEFGTLMQSVHQGDVANRHIFILFPWDFLGCLDWRTGISKTQLSIPLAVQEIDDFVSLMSTQISGNFFFLDATVLPVMGLSSDMFFLRDYISLASRRLGCTSLDPSFFCLKTYLDNGCPFSSISLSHVGEIVVSNIVSEGKSLKKVIVSDLDFTFWHGVLGEVGPKGIQFGPNGSGYIHFIYQTFLKKLKDSGVILCVSSKNDEDLVQLAFSENNFVVGYDDFVAIQASYKPKSTEILGLSQALNIGLSDFVFIDDNPVEIESVKIALPSVTCIQFPKEGNQFSIMLDQLHSEFQVSSISDEDKNRSNLYRTMKASSVDASYKKADIDTFLQSLEMEVELSYRSVKDNERAVQLINKTNQFNSNGIRLTKAECDKLLENGSSLITASLRDKNGDHGQILAMLLDKGNRVLSFVMSCRVFQRQAEIIFMAALFETGIDELYIDYLETERNEPFKLFLSNFFANIESGKFTVTPDLILDSFPCVKNLYKVKGL